MATGSHALMQKDKSKGLSPVYASPLEAIDAMMTEEIYRPLEENNIKKQ